MIEQMIARVRDARSWILSPGQLIDRFLDHIDKLNTFVLPGTVDNPAYRHVEVKARLERFGA
jgi:hypothetical protein